MIAKEQNLGVLTILTKEEHQFSNDEVNFFTSLASQAAIAIHNSQLYENITEKTIELQKANQQLSALYSVSNTVNESASLESMLQSVMREVLEIFHFNAARVYLLNSQLHPSILDDLGLVDAIKSLCTGFSEQEGIPVEFTPENLLEDLTNDLSLCLYRITQESLRNIAKHAQAKEAHVTLDANNGSVILSIRDSGVGFDLAQARRKPGLGLASMEERVRLIHGSLSVQSEPAQGTTIEVRAPLARRDV